jgi:hypothetical protein
VYTRYVRIRTDVGIDWMAGVGSRSRDVECISSSCDGPFDVLEKLLFSSPSWDVTREAVERVIASADKPKMGK